MILDTTIKQSPAFLSLGIVRGGSLLNIDQLYRTASFSSHRPGRDGLRDLCTILGSHRCCRVHLTPGELHNYYKTRLRPPLCSVSNKAPLFGETGNG